MPTGDTIITVAGNLTADPELSYTGKALGFGNPERPSGATRSTGGALCDYRGAGLGTGGLPCRGPAA